MPYDGTPRFAPYSLRTRLFRRAAGCPWTAAAIIAGPFIAGAILGWLAG